MKKDWEIKKLDEVCTVFEDGDWIESKDQSNGGIRLIQTGNIGNGFFKDRGEKARYISKETFKRLRCTEIFEGDCLISRLPDPVGRACILPDTGEPMITAVDCTIIRFNKERIISDWFLFYSLAEEYQKEINKQVTGATRQRISRKNLGFIKIPIPPLPEQQHIVSILDEAFAAIAKAKANAQQNLQNAKELFESYLQSVFENKGEDWEEKILKEITTILGDGLHGTPKYKTDGDYYFINGNNLNNGVIEIKDNTKRVSVDEYKKYNKNLNDRTVLVSINGTLCNIAFFNNEKIILGKSACYFNLKEGIDKSYIKYVLSSMYFIKYAHKEATGATIKNVSLKTMREFKVPLPNLQEQQTIVQKLDDLSLETKKLESIYKKKIEDFEELKKSILQKAFAGELTTNQIPELA
ncbi:MAG: restriction endonuclease subunit S [Chitinophagaceae bacterium]